MAPRHFKNDDASNQIAEPAGAATTGNQPDISPGDSDFTSTVTTSSKAATQLTQARQSGFQRSDDSTIKTIEARGATSERRSYSRRDMLENTGRSPLMYIFAAAVVVLLLGAAAFFIGPRVLAMFEQDQEIVAGLTVNVFIPEGSTTRQIGQTLKDAQVIRNINEFVEACQRQNASDSLRPGKYELTTGMPLEELIDVLVAGPPDNRVKLTIPEGLTIEQTAARVEAACAIPAADFLAEAYNATKYESEYPFLKGCYNNSLEGFLYPKTYQIPHGANAEYVVRILLNQFRIETTGIDFSYAELRGFTPYDVLVIASMIEKETYQTDERALVSSVIYNRVGSDIRLQIDATVVYALADFERDYGEKPLLYADLEVDSPYNTYAHYGIPPGPICSPQIASIIAAAAPETTDYYFYVLTSKDGTHTFCRNSTEFEEAKKIYNQVFGSE
jgi:UPF0755 protein